MRNTNNNASILLPKTPLSPNSNSDQATTTTTTTTLLVSDWELTHCGPRALDLGQMLAELYLLKHFKDIDAGESIARGFLQGYYPPLSEDMAFRTLIHVGVHFIFFGSVVPGWGSEEQVEGIVRLGREFVVRAWGRDREWFEGWGVWEVLFKGV